MRRAMWSFCAVQLAICGIFLLALDSCTGTEEQAVRHVVLAELIQREHQPQGAIEIQSVDFISQDRTVVLAKVLARQGRASGWHKLRCTVERDAGRWVFRKAIQE